MNSSLTFIIAAVAVLSSGRAQLPQSNSLHLRTSSPVTLSQATPIVLLSGYVPNTDEGKLDLFLVADGALTPNGWGGCGELVIETSTDGLFYQESSNRSRVGWIDNGQGSQLPAAHCFNCVGYERITGEGLHVRLVASQLAAGYSCDVLPYAALSAMVRNYETGISSRLQQATGNLAAGVAVNQWTWSTGTSPQSNLIIGQTLPNNGAQTPLIFCTSGSATRLTTSGDAMLGIWFSGQALRTHEGNWSINDMWPYAEISAPVFNHGMVLGATLSGQTVEWRGSKLWWGPSSPTNNVGYRVAESAEIVSMWDSTVFGRSTRMSLPTTDTHTATQVQFLSSMSQPGYVAPGVPDLVSRHPVGSTTVTIPSGHSGVVCFLGKARFQPHANSTPTPPDFGHVLLYLTLDPISTPGLTQVGSIGVQETRTNQGLGSESQRTMSCSYVSAGIGALPPGQYAVQLYIMGAPFTSHSFYQTGYYVDCSLIFFD